MKYALTYHTCEKDCCYALSHETTSGESDNVTYYLRVEQYDEHVIDWVLSKCKCEECEAERGK